jgi:hypothetical protein
MRTNGIPREFVKKCVFNEPESSLTSLVPSGGAANMDDMNGGNDNIITAWTKRIMLTKENVANRIAMLLASRLMPKSPAIKAISISNGLDINRAPLSHTVYRSPRHEPVACQ